MVVVSEVLEATLATVLASPPIVMVSPTLGLVRNDVPEPVTVVPPAKLETVPGPVVVVEPYCPKVGLMVKVVGELV